MLRGLTLLFVVLVASTFPGGAPASAASQTVISGGGIAQPIRLPPVDEVALFQRVSLPPRLEDPPQATGTSFTIRSPYWPTVLPGNGKDRPPALEEAEYFPEGGFARASQGGKDAWLVLDVRQRAILDRYIRLGEAGLISGTPSIVQVLVAEWKSGGSIGITVGSTALNAADGARVLASLEGVPAQTTPGASAVPPSQLPPSSAWLTFSLPEGREVRLLYTPASGTLVDFTAVEYYPVPARWLESLLGPEFAPRAPAVTAASVPRDKGAGSPIWWLVMIGGGLALIGAAVYLSRGWARQKAGP